MQNVASKAFSDNGYEQLGFYFLGFSYACMGLGSLLAPHAMGSLGNNTCMVVGSVFDALWVLAQLAPAAKTTYLSEIDPTLPETGLPFYFTDWFIVSINIFAAVTSGFGSSFLWVA